MATNRSTDTDEPDYEALASPSEEYWNLGYPETEFADNPDLDELVHLMVSMHAFMCGAFAEASKKAKRTEVMVDDNPTD